MVFRKGNKLLFPQWFPARIIDLSHDNCYYPWIMTNRRNVCKKFTSIGITFSIYAKAGLFYDDWNKFFI